MVAAPVAPTTAGAPSPAAAATPVASAAKTATKKKKPVKASGAGTQAKPKKPVRKRKPPTKSSVASNQTILNDARAASHDLAYQRAQAAARRSDPLWYRIEDVLPVVQEASTMAPKAGILPEQVQVVEAALAHHGMTRADVTPQALACLLEQARRFAQELIADAQDYAYTVNRADVSRADLLLASEMRADHPIATSTQLPKLNLVSQQLNRVPLPPIPSHCYSGILLPPKQHQLTARTYDVVSGAQVYRRMTHKAPEAPKKKQSTTTQPGYGASRGRQIPVKLKEQSVAGPTPMDTSGSGEVPTKTATSLSGLATATPTQATPLAQAAPPNAIVQSTSAPKETSQESHMAQEP
jgi:histone H3/H4